MRNFFAGCIILIVVPVIVNLLLNYIEKNNAKELLRNIREECIDIRLPRIYILIGCITTTFFMFLFLMMIFFPNGTENVWVGIVFWLFIFLGTIIVLMALIWKIQICRHEQHFIYRTIFGSKYVIQYKDIVYYKWRSNVLILRTDDKSFFVDTKATNFEFLTAMLTKYKVREISE